jgi:predicted GNAT family N-acyltransferase
MNMKLTTCEDSLDAIRSVRDAVFIQEQKVPQELEWDGTDSSCIHIVATDDNDNPVGTGRLQSDGRIGRLAVLKPLRCQGVGSAMLEALVNSARSQGLTQVYLHSQLHAVPFYVRRGFEKVGGEFLEAGIPHINMTRSIPQSPGGKRICGGQDTQ